jgi:RNA polymerase sigma-70 factor (ECF subfamily)
VYLQVGAEDEDGLIGRCLAGDRAAFEPLVERYHRPLFRVAVRLLGDRDEAQDMTQITFLKAYAALATCDRRRRFFSWIYRILVNECLNALRARRPVQGLDETMAAPGPAALGVPEKTVKSRLFSARQRLCELLAAERV